MKFEITRERFPIYTLGSGIHEWISGHTTYSITDDDHNQYFVTKEEFYSRIKEEKYKQIPKGCQLSFDF